MSEIDVFQISEIKISYDPIVAAKDRQKITSSQDAYKIFRHYWDDISYRESFCILILNRANKVLGIKMISQGGMHGTVADPKLIFATALKAAGCSIILCHNHPSDNLKPSENDIALTKKCTDAGKALDLLVLDHIIIGPSDGYYSFADESML